MKLIFKKTDQNVHLPRKVKDEVKKTIKQKFECGSLDGLHKMKIGNHSAPDRDYAIYSTERVDSTLVVQKTNTNYLIGKITTKVSYLVDLGEFVWINGSLHIMPEAGKRIQIVLI